MPEFNRPFPPPPPNRPVPQRPEPQPQVELEKPAEMQMAGDKPQTKTTISPKTKFGLLIAGGVASFAVALTCLVLIFIV